MVLVCLRWLATFAGIDLGVPAEKFGADAAIRVIDGPYTFFLAHAAVLTVPFWGLRRRAGTQADAAGCGAAYCSSWC